MVAIAQQQPVEVKGGYKIDIMTSAICDMCKHAIEYDLTFRKGIKDVNLDLDTKVVSVVYNPKKTDTNTIRKHITMVGYHADSLQRDPVAYEKLPFCCKDGGHDDDH